MGNSLNAFFSVRKEDLNSLVMQVNFVSDVMRLPV